MEKRLIFAIALSILIIVSFQYLSPKPPAPQVLPESTATPVSTSVGTAIKDEALLSPAPLLQSPDEKEFVVETGKAVITFTNIGGSIKSIQLKDYKDLSSGEFFVLADVQDPRERIFAMTSSGIIAGLDSAVYDLKKIGEEVIYSTQAKGFEITKRYRLHNSNYTIGLQIFIKNISPSPRDLNYRLIYGSGLMEKNAQDARLLEVSAKINEKPTKFKRPKPGERIINPGSVNWTVVKSKYFSIALKPLSGTAGQYYSENKAGQLISGVESETITLQPGATIENRFILFAGPSHIPVLKEAGYGLEETINYGFFGGISKAILSTLRFCHKIVRSWGVSIILLSIFLNILLFPLTMKSFKSMQKMQELHPQMEKLKVQHKGSPEKLNKEMMELYKKYKINPLSGCLPMLLQMPIFVALYQALMKSLELRNASFLWIKDLSSPDAVRLPFTLPLIGNSINILPLIMVAGMVIQQKISTKSTGGAVTDEQKQQQKMMLIIMPIMFGFIFYNMPSGLVLYWVVNTALTIVEQGAILKKA